MQRTFLIVAFGILFLFAPYASAGDDPMVQRLQDGETKKVYWGVNLKGVVYVSIRGRTGPGCAHMFWRPIPTFGRTIALNDVCGNIRTEIPGASTWAIGGELWARANQGDVAFVLSSNERLAYDFPAFEIP